jgi:hypothetical protein
MAKRPGKARKALGITMALLVGGTILLSPIIAGNYRPISNEVKHILFGYQTPTPAIVFVDPTEMATRFQPTPTIDNLVTPTWTPFAPADNTSTPTFTPLPSFTPTPVLDYVRLEDRITLNIPVEQVQLSEWEMFYLQHMIPIANITEKAAARYRFDPLVSMEAFVNESALYPLAVNPVTNDYGLAQIKPEAFLRMYHLGTDPNSPYYYLDLKQLDLEFNGTTNIKQIFDLNSNVIMFHLMMAYNRDQTGLQDPLVLYAYYVKGPNAVDRQGNLTEAGMKVVGVMPIRYEYIKNVVPLLGLGIDEINRLADPQIRDTLLLGLDDPAPEVAYQRYLDYDISFLQSRSEDYTGSGTVFLKDAVFYCNAVQFAMVEHQIYGVDETSRLLALKSLGEAMKMTFDGLYPEVENVVNKYYGLAVAEMNK